MLQFHELFIRKLSFVKKKNLHYLISFQGWTRPTKIPEMRNHDFCCSKKHTLLVSFTSTFGASLIFSELRVVVVLLRHVLRPLEAAGEAAVLYR